jgi:predicted  nucleic acid-binding Zn-ribbon protein
MHPDLPLLMELQAVDKEITRLNAEIASLPGHIAKIEAKLKSHVEQVEQDRKTLAAHHKERKDFEREIAAVREKISKYREQMTAVKTNDQYRALQSEIEFAETSIKQFEEKILEKMVLDEGLEGAVKKAQAALDTEQAAVEKEKVVVNERTRRDQAALTEKRQQRQGIVAQITELSYSEYTRLSRKPPAIAEIRNGACMGCRVRLRPQAINELLSNSTIRYCESCHRIWFFVAPEKASAS